MPTTTPIAAAAVADDGRQSAAVLRIDTAVNEGRTMFGPPCGIVESTAPTGFGRATGAIQVVASASRLIRVAGAGLHREPFTRRSDALQDPTIPDASVDREVSASDGTHGGSTRVGGVEDGARDETAPCLAKARDMSDRSGGMTSSFDARESPLAAQLSALIDELTSAADHLSLLSDRLGALSPADAEVSYRHGIGELLKTLNRAADSEVDTHSRKSSVRLCVENYIDRNLSSKMISPEGISKELEIPRSSLYKSFSGSGGVARYIQNRRLDVANTLLSHPEEYRSLIQIADALGFESAAHFSKAFRRRFKCSPREVRKISTILTSQPRPS